MPIAHTLDHWGSWFDAATANAVIHRFASNARPQRAVIGAWNHGATQYVGAKENPFPLLAQMKESMPAPAVAKLFSQIAEDLASEYSSQMQGMGMEERLEFVKEMLAQEGFTVEWEKKGNDYQIHEISCPYYQIGVAHPEVCTVDQTLISKMLALPANKVQCILDGGAHCTYVVHPIAVKN